VGALLLIHPFFLSFSSPLAARLCFLDCEEDALSLYLVGQERDLVVSAWLVWDNVMLFAACFAMAFNVTSRALQCVTSTLKRQSQVIRRFILSTCYLCTLFPTRSSRHATAWEVRANPCATPMMIFPQLSQHDDDDGESLQQVIERYDTCKVKSRPLQNPTYVLAQVSVRT
jgi:hypothetical protein